MKIIKIFLILVITNALISCADYKKQKIKETEERKYYSSKGFALIFEENLYQQKIVNKKITNTEKATMHNF